MEIIKPAIIPEYTDHSTPILEPKLEPTIEQLEEYVKQHPELVIPKANDSPLSAIGHIKNLLANPIVRGMLQANPDWINSQIDLYGANYKFLIMPWLKQTYPDLYYAINPNEIEAGDENYQGNGENTQERSNEEFTPLEAEYEDIVDIPDEVFDEAIQYMVRCRNKGYTYSHIREKLNSKYQIDLTPTVIQKYVVNFEEEQELDPGQSSEDIDNVPDKAKEAGLKKIQAMYSELTQLRAKVIELEKEKAELKHKEEIKQAVQTALKEQSASKKGLFDFLKH